MLTRPALFNMRKNIERGNLAHLKVSYLYSLGLQAFSKFLILFFFLASTIKFFYCKGHLEKAWRPRLYLYGYYLKTANRHGPVFSLLIVYSLKTLSIARSSKNKVRILWDRSLSQITPPYLSVVILIVHKSILY